MSKQSRKFTIKDWDESDRPREKLYHQGASFLSNAELLALLIGSGSLKESAVDLTKRVLNSVANDLHKLHRVSLERLIEFNGIGLAKAVKIKAAMELSRRLTHQKQDKAPLLNSSKLVYQQIRYQISSLGHEEFWILYLNQASKLLEKYCLSKGGITQTVVDIRLALKRAFELNATTLILVHNHPSGSLIPSERDMKLTQKFKHAAKYVDLSVVDHLIVSEKGYFSFADKGII
jgi:DNA repair protein RadC